MKKLLFIMIMLVSSISISQTTDNSWEILETLITPPTTVINIINVESNGTSIYDNVQRTLFNDNTTSLIEQLYIGQSLGLKKDDIIYYSLMNKSPLDPIYKPVTVDNSWNKLYNPIETHSLKLIH